MVKVEKATRLPQREGSFAELRGEDVVGLDRAPLNSNADAPPLSSESNPSRLSSMPEGSSAPIPSLVTENELLRRHVEELQSQLQLLQHHYQQAIVQNKNGKVAAVVSGKPGVLLELPRAMRGSIELNCIKGRGGRGIKEHQSFSTEDDQSTIEPTMDWDLHESASGLKQRHFMPPDSPTRTNQRSTHKTVPSPAHKMDALKSMDGSLSSRGSEGEFLDEENGGISSESRELIRSPISSQPAAPNRGIEEQTFWQCVSDRAGWLVGLLVMQSMSSFILARNEALLQQHLVIVRFLTMLVGAGGNAGNQASVRVIRGLAVGSIDDSNSRRFLRREFIMGTALSLILGTAGCIRAAIFMTPFLETVAITASLFMIVIISIVLGAMLPLGMRKAGIDPAHSSTTIQVIMDILGVSITVMVSSLVLDSGFHTWLLSYMSDGNDNL